jgi:hypothetical protein
MATILGKEKNALDAGTDQKTLISCLAMASLH